MQPFLPRSCCFWQQYPSLSSHLCRTVSCILLPPESYREQQRLKTEQARLSPFVCCMERSLRGVWWVHLLAMKPIILHTEPVVSATCLRSFAMCLSVESLQATTGCLSAMMSWMRHGSSSRRCSRPSRRAERRRRHTRTAPEALLARIIWQPSMASVGGTLWTKTRGSSPPACLHGGPPSC